MKCAQLTEIGQPLVVGDAPTPELAPDEVLVATHACGVCRTDLHIQDGLAYVPNLPHIPGHEPAGVVVACGPAVQGIAVGRRVVPHLFVNRAECAYTRAGQHAQATHLDGIIGVTLPGGFAEYFKAPARNLLPLPDGVSSAAGGLVSCAAITVVHALGKSNLRAGDTAAVLGAGGIGLMLIQLLRARGIRTVALSRSPRSRELALEAGADAALPIDDDAARARVLHQLGGDRDGVDVVFELVGTAATMRAAAGVVRRGGRIVVIGEEAEFPAIDTIQIAQRELEIVGSRNGGMQDAIDAIELLSAGVIRPRIAARFPLDKINDALDLVRRGNAHGRVIIDVRESAAAP